MMLVRFLLFLLSFVSFVMAEIKVYGTVDANRISVDETVNFKVTAEASGGFPQLDIMQVKDFTVISGPSQSSSFQWINGKMSSSKSLSWTLIPNRTGTLVIPPLHVTVDRKTFRLEPISITVVRSRAPRPKGESRDQPPEETEMPIIFLEAEADKEEAYQGEQITVQYKLYARVNLRQYSMEKKPRGVGFWLEELYTPKQPSLRETRIDGDRYKVATLYKIALFPTTDGELILDPMVLTCTIEVPPRRRTRSLFDDFFSDQFFSRTEQRIVKSEALKFKVKPVPHLGKPSDYSGAVGDFELSSFLDTTATEVNEAITYTIELEGTGNLDLFQINEPLFPTGLEVFKPKRTFEKDPFRDQISGTKRFEYVLIPRNEGRFFIPAAELTFFNPTTGEWESVSTEVLTVEAKPGRIVFQQGQGLTKEEIALLGQDIRYIRTAPRKLKPLDRHMIPNQFWMFGILGLLLFAGPRVVEGVRTGRKERSEQIKARKALRRAQKSLKNVRDANGYPQVTRALYRYFAEKLNVAHASLDAGAVQDLLNKKVDPSLLNTLTEILSVCEEAEYAPIDRSSVENDAGVLARSAADLLARIDGKV